MTDKKQEPRWLVDEEILAMWNAKCSLIDCCSKCHGTDLNCDCYKTYFKIWDAAKGSPMPQQYPAEQLFLRQGVTWAEAFRIKHPDHKVIWDGACRDVLLGRITVEMYDKLETPVGTRIEAYGVSFGTWKYGGK